MKKESFTLAGKQCFVLHDEKPEVLLIQPVDEHDIAVLDHQAELIASGLQMPMLLAAVRIDRWNEELSPWKAPAVFGPESFGDGAQKTLGFVQDELLPAVFSKYTQCKEIPVILGGYSLAGFFSLWCAYQTPVFSAVAAVSPSVWFPGWIEYAGTRKPQASFVYLSLGNKEEKTKNRVMAAVGECIRTQQRLLDEQGIANQLEWNEGNHFKDPDIRCAKGFIRCVDEVKAQKQPRENV